MASLIVVFLLSHILRSIGITTAQECNNTAGNFTSNSTYATNRNLILSYLASNITANGGFYINATIGQDPNKVYALAICRGDSLPTDCSNCVNSTGQDLILSCPVQDEAFSWGGGSCMVRYAKRSFFGVVELNPVDSGYNTANISWDSEDFYQTWTSLMDQVVNKASVGSSSLKYGTGEANLTTFQTIYALMQCTPDLSETDCNYCLGQNVAEFENCCSGWQGGYVLRPNCLFRWDMYPFYVPMADALGPSPPPPSSPPPLPIKDNGGIASRTIVIIVVATIISMTLVALTFILYRRRKTKKYV